MWRAGLVVTVLLCGPLALQAQKKPPFPKDPPPQVALATAREVAAGIELRLAMPQPRQEMRERTVERNGNTYTERYLVTVLVPQVRTVIVYDEKKNPLAAALRGAKVLDLKGEKVGRKKILEVLKKETPVLFSAAGRVDPFYLQVIKEGTLLISLPRKFVPKAKTGAQADRARD